MDFLRGFLAIVASLLVGAGICFGVNAWIYGSPEGGYGSMQSLQGTWGVIAGLVAGVSSAAFIATARLSERSRRNLWTGFGFFSLAAGVLHAWWVSVSAGWPPLSSLEGAWIYPLLVALLGFAAFALSRRKERHSRTNTALKW